MSPEPTADRADSGHAANANRRRRFGLSLALALGPIAAGFSYFGTRDAWVIADRLPDASRAAPPGEGADPAWDIELPEGPHRDEFQTSCLICHSASPDSGGRGGPRSYTRWWPLTGHR